MPFDDEMTERERWAEDHGYMQYRCPGCHKLFYSDSGPVGNCPCGWMPEEIAEEWPEDMRQSDPAETSAHGRPGWNG